MFREGFLRGRVWFAFWRDRGFDQRRTVTNFGDPSGQKYVGGRRRDTHTADKVRTHGHTLLFYWYRWHSKQISHLEQTRLNAEAEGLSGNLPSIKLEAAVSKPSEEMPFWDLITEASESFRKLQKASERVFQWKKLPVVQAVGFVLRKGNSFSKIPTLVPWQRFFLDRGFSLTEVFPWQRFFLDRGFSLTEVFPWQRFFLDRGFSLTEVFPWQRFFLDRGFSLTEVFPWQRFFLDRGFSLTEVLPWQRFFLDRGFSLTEVLPWQRFFLDRGFSLTFQSHSGAFIRITTTTFCWVLEVFFGNSLTKVWWE